MKIFKNILLCISIILIIFLLLELLSIKLFPELSNNQIYVGKKIINQNVSSTVTKSKKQIFEKFNDFNIRSSLDELDQNFINNIWIFGDSVTAGYGLKYTDTYYYILNKKLKSLKHNFRVLPVAGYGNDLSNVLEIINKNPEIFKKDDFFIFQFNYNDILPKTFSKNLNNNLETQKDTSQGSFIKKINSFRYQYLNSSAFIRVLTHYASNFKKKTSGDCKKRSLDALGQYTYSYGSVNFEKESLNAWNFFEKKLLNLKSIIDKKNLNFIVLISPITLQLSNHEKSNHHNYDLECSTINGRNKLLQILNLNNITYSDPLDLFEEVINKDLQEKNFEPLFFEYDTNHPNEKGNLLISISLLQTLNNIID